MVHLLLKFLACTVICILSVTAIQAQEENGSTREIITGTDTLPVAGKSSFAEKSKGLLPLTKVSWSGLPKDKIRVWPLAMFVLATDFRHDRVFITKTGLQEEIKEDLFKNFHSSADNYLQFLPSVSPLLLDLFKVPSYHDKPQRNLMMLESNLLTIVSSGILKKTFHDRRPDGSGFSSFPSGHTAIAFTGAAILDHEYGQQYPWIKWAGYGLATLVGISRIANNRHWASDVLGGAALGIINVDLVYWLNKKKPGHHIHQPLLVP